MLKDAASAAIYGTRAANGVILIETKKGEKGKLQISYNSYFGKTKARELPENINSWEHAELLNEARLSMGQGAAFTDADIEKYRSGSDPDNFPNIDRLKWIMNTGSGFQMNHDVTFSGGTDKMDYIFALGYLDENGNVEGTNYNRYSMLSNINFNIRDNLALRVNIVGDQNVANEPVRIYNTSLAMLLGWAEQDSQSHNWEKIRWHLWSVAQLRYRANHGFRFSSSQGWS